MKWEAIVELGRELPGVDEGRSYGTPALEVRGKQMLTRLARLRAPECRERLEGAWREKAPKTLIKRYDEERDLRGGRARAGKR